MRIMRTRKRIDKPEVLALEYCIDTLGGAEATKTLFGLSTAWSVNKWRLSGGLPLKHVAAMVEKVRAKGGTITHHQLAPQHYPVGT